MVGTAGENGIVSAVLVDQEMMMIGKRREAVMLLVQKTHKISK